MFAAPKHTPTPLPFPIPPATGMTVVDVVLLGLAVIGTVAGVLQGAVSARRLWTWWRHMRRRRSR